MKDKKKKEKKKRKTNYMSMPIYWEVHTKSGEEKNTPNRPNPLWILTQQSALETPHKHYGGFFFQYFLSLLINFYMLKFIRIVYIFLDIRAQFIFNIFKST